MFSTKLCLSTKSKRQCAQTHGQHHQFYVRFCLVLLSGLSGCSAAEKMNHHTECQTIIQESSKSYLPPFIVFAIGFVSQRGHAIHPPTQRLAKNLSGGVFSSPKSARSEVTYQTYPLANRVDSKSATERHDLPKEGHRFGQLLPFCWQSRLQGLQKVKASLPKHHGKPLIFLIFQTAES